MTNNDLELPKRSFALSNDQYDLWNRVVTMVIPALIVFWSTIAVILNLSYGETVTLILGAVVVLGKALLNASKRSYEDAVASLPPVTDGTISIDTQAGEVTRFDLLTTDTESVAKGFITLEVKEASVQD